MIKINLALKKSPAGLGADGKPASVSVDKTALQGFLKEIPIKKIAIPLAVSIGASFLVDEQKAEELGKAIAQATAAQTEVDGLKARLEKTKGYEAVKKQIEADQLVLQTKLELLKRLVDGRDRPALSLRAIAGAIPAEVWLTDLRVTTEEATFRGASKESKFIPTFMKELERTPYFKDVDFKSPQQTRDDSGQEVQAFELVAKKR